MRFSLRRLHQAAYQLNSQAVHDLLSICPSLEALNGINQASKKSALHRACEKEGTQTLAHDPLQVIVYQLLTIGLDPNLQDAKGNTALHYAVVNNTSPNVIMMLLVFGAQAHLRNHAGQLPIDLVAGTDLVLREILSRADNIPQLLYQCIKNGFLWPFKILLMKASFSEINTLIEDKTLLQHAFTSSPSFNGTLFHQIPYISLLAVAGHHDNMSENEKNAYVLDPMLIQSYQRLLHNLTSDPEMAEPYGSLIATYPLDVKTYYLSLFAFMHLNDLHGFTAKLKEIYHKIQIIFPLRLSLSLATIAAIQKSVRHLGWEKTFDLADQQATMLTEAYIATECIRITQANHIKTIHTDLITPIAAALIALDPILANFFEIDFLCSCTHKDSHTLLLLRLRSENFYVNLTELIFDPSLPGFLCTHVCNIESLVSATDKYERQPIYFVGTRHEKVQTQLAAFKMIFDEVFTERTSAAQTTVTPFIATLAHGAHLPASISALTIAPAPSASLCAP